MGSLFETESEVSAGFGSWWISCTYVLFFKLSIFCNYNYVLAQGQMCLLYIVLDPSCCKMQPKKSPNQETGFGNKGHMKVQNDIKIILNDQWSHAHLGTNWYHSEPWYCSGLSEHITERPYSNQPAPSLFSKPVSWLGLFLTLLIAKQL